MGLDLTIALDEYNCPEMRKSFLATSTLSFRRDYDIFTQIAGCRADEESPAQVCTPKPIPKGNVVLWYKDEGIDDSTKSPYGDRLTYVTAGELCKVKLDTRFPTHQFNKAIFAMIRELPPESWVILYWH